MLRMIDDIRRRPVVGAILALLAAGALSGCGGMSMMGGDKLSFALVAANSAPATDSVKHLLVLSGHGKFTADSVRGRGNYTYTDAATKVPKKILSTGRWKATDVISWTPSEGGATYGHVRPGVLDLRIDIMQDEGPVIEGAILRINCNVGSAGIKNKDPDSGEKLAEGYWLTIPDGASFGPTTGVGTFAPRDPIVGLTEIAR